MTTKISLAIDISSNEYNYADMEKLRLAIRQGLLAFIFQSAETVNIDHTRVAVDGDIKLHTGI